MVTKDENRLYFIVRSILLSNIIGIMILTIIWYLRTINFIQSIIIGSCAFVISLLISRFFDPQIERLVIKLLRFLEKHQRLKRFILKYF